MTDFAHPTRGMHCPIHAVQLICPSCQGEKGGKAKSTAKTLAARQNGKKGGRPKKHSR